MSAFFSAFQTVSDFFGSIFSRLWSFVADYPFVLAAVGLPLFFWLLAGLIRLVQDSSGIRIGKAGEKLKKEKGWRVPSLTAKGRLIAIDGKLYDLGGKRGWGKTRHGGHKEKAGKEETA